MEIRRKYLQKYMHQIMIDQLYDEYHEKGYAVFIEEKVGRYVADLVARKGKDMLVIEVKAGRINSNRKDAIMAIANYVNTIPSAKFLVVLATLPKEKKIEFDELSDLLFQYMLNNLPDELDQLSSHTRLSEVADIEVDDIDILKDGSINIQGSATVSVSLQSGSDSESDDFDVSYDNYPFEFKISLEQVNQNWEISNDGFANYIKVDTSKYYE